MALAVAMATSGTRASPVEMLFTVASMIAAVNSILGAAGLALLAGQVASLSTGSAIAVGIIVGVILFALHVLYGYQRAAPIAGGRPLPLHRLHRPVGKTH